MTPQEKMKAYQSEYRIAQGKKPNVPRNCLFCDQIIEKPYAVQKYHGKIVDKTSCAYRALRQRAITKPILVYRSNKKVMMYSDYLKKEAKRKGVPYKPIKLKDYDFF